MHKLLVSFCPGVCEEEVSRDKHLTGTCVSHPCRTERANYLSNATITWSRGALFFSAWLVALRPFLAEVSAEPRLSAHCFDPFPGSGNVAHTHTHTLITRGPHFPFLCDRCFHTVCSNWSAKRLPNVRSFTNGVKCLNLQSAPELQAHQHHPVKE